MTTLTIPQVRAWQPAVLDSAAAKLGTASSAVEEQVSVMRTALERALDGAGGAWATSAAERAADEARTGVQLSDALETARTVLQSGAVDIGTARTALLDRIEAARAEGFAVTDDGMVTPPTEPPVMSSPEDASAASAARNARQRVLNDRAGVIATDLGTALQAVSSADGVTARGLGDIAIPESLESAVDAYIKRVMSSHDLLGSLGKAGLGAAALALTLKNAVKLFGKSSALVKFFAASAAPITDYATFLKNMGAADDALATFMRGQANGGFARFLMGSKVAKFAGKAFLPLTVITGAADAITGGGYEGARGWATRGFGLAGAVGAGTLIASSAGLIALGPVGLGIAGVAVVGYGLWAGGNYVYDHWDDIKDFGGKAMDWTGDRWNDTTEAVGNATSWAGDRLSDAGSAISEAGKSTVHTLSFGLLG